MTKEKEPKMNFRTINVANLPVLRGKNTPPRIAVASNGQIVLNGKAGEMFGTAKYAKILFADDQRIMAFKPVEKVVKGEEKATLEVKTSKKDKRIYFNGAGLFHEIAKDGVEMYDYRASGSQSFDVINLGANGIGFTLPAGKLNPRPFTPRKR